MKYLMAALLFASVNTFATESENQTEAIKVANVLLAVSDATQQVSREGLSISTYKAVTLSEGLTQYTFQLSRNCFCPAKTGTLSILEDRTPTFVDGPALYTYEFKVDKP